MTVPSSRRARTRWKTPVWPSSSVAPSPGRTSSISTSVAFSSDVGMSVAVGGGAGSTAGTTACTSMTNVRASPAWIRRPAAGPVGEVVRDVELEALARGDADEALVPALDDAAGADRDGVRVAAEVGVELLAVLGAHTDVVDEDGVAGRGRRAGARCQRRLDELGRDAVGDRHLGHTVGCVAGTSVMSVTRVRSVASPVRVGRMRRRRRRCRTRRASTVTATAASTAGRRSRRDIAGGTVTAKGKTRVVRHPWRRASHAASASPSGVDGAPLANGHSSSAIRR